MRRGIVPGRWSSSQGRHQCWCSPETRQRRGTREGWWSPPASAWPIAAAGWRPCKCSLPRHARWSASWGSAGSPTPRSTPASLDSSRAQMVLSTTPFHSGAASAHYISMSLRMTSLVTGQKGTTVAELGINHVDWSLEYIGHRACPDKQSHVSRVHPDQPQTKKWRKERIARMASSQCA